MPYYCIEPAFASNDKLHHILALKILIGKNEVLDDSVLDNLPDWMKASPYLMIGRWRLPGDQPDLWWIPLKIGLTKECLGRWNPKGFFLNCKHTGLTDELFSECTQLEYVALGTSDEPVFPTTLTHLASQPLKRLEVSGWGLFSMSEAFQKFIDENKTGEKKFDFIYWV